MGQLSFLESAGHIDHHEPVAIIPTGRSGNGIRPPFVAIDFGSHLYVSTAGEPGERKRNTTRFLGGEDLVDLIGDLFIAGYDVVTEAPTMRSFGPRGHTTELIALLHDHPARRLWTIGSQQVQNELRRTGVEYDSAIDHPIAAATIWTLALRNGAKLWRPPNPAETIQRFDPVRPNVTGLVQLRNDRYPAARMRRDVYPFLPESGNLTPEQRVILNNGRVRADDRCAALVWSLREPLSRTRRGWERVVGASSHGRPNIYRQMLIVGKPRRDYQHHVHFTGLRFTDAIRALRGLRSLILAVHPDLPSDVQKEVA